MPKDLMRSMADRIRHSLGRGELVVLEQQPRQLQLATPGPAGSHAGEQLPAKQAPAGGGGPGRGGGGGEEDSKGSMDVKTLMQGNWTSKLFGCFDDIPICFFGTCCPCILASMSAKRIGEEPCMYCMGVATCCCPMMVPLRAKTRDKYNIKDDLKNDTLLSGPCCLLCSNCQVANEIKKRGGWDI